MKKDLALINAVLMKGLFFSAEINKPSNKPLPDAEKGYFVIFYAR
jgi:hypothetical protein